MLSAHVIAPFVRRRSDLSGVERITRRSARRGKRPRTERARSAPRHATGRKTFATRGLLLHDGRHRACVGRHLTEHKELPEMSGPQSENPRVPVLRESETALDSLRIKTLAAAPPPPPSEPNDWQRILGAVLRHKWLVLGITLLGTVVGVVATRFLDPRYTAKTILWVDVDVGRDRGIASPDEFMGTKGWVELVTSNIVLDTVVQQRRLFVTPIEPGDSTAVSGLNVTDRVIPGAYRLIVDKDGGTLRLEKEDRTLVRRGRGGEPLGGHGGFEWAPAPDQLEGGDTGALQGH